VAHYCKGAANTYYLYLDQINRFQQPGCGGHLTSVQHSTSGWDDLSASAMNGVGVQSDVVDVEANASHVFFAHNALKASN